MSAPDSPHEAPPPQPVSKGVAAVVQEQLDAYNARDLPRFLATYHDDVLVHRLPKYVATLFGKEALGSFYARELFNRPALHAELLQRIVMGNKVIDHERVSGVGDRDFEAVAVYEVTDGLIRAIWFVDPVSSIAN